MISNAQLHRSTTAQLRAAGCVFAEDEATLLIAEAESEIEVTSMVEHRIAGLPIEYILGWAEFCDLRILVGSYVFVPRRRSEYLVEQAATLVQSGDTVVDLCCGSGALGAALYRKNSSIKLFSADIEPAAIAYARQNLDAIGTVFQGDLFDALPPSLRGSVDLIMVNAPYIPTDEIRLQPAEARLYEPTITLDGGTDGLDVQRRIAADAAVWLAPQGNLIIETGEDQAVTTQAIFSHGELETRIVQKRELDLTVVIAHKA